MIFSSEDFTSLISPFNRFSNSPLTPAPACQQGLDRASEYARPAKPRQSPADHAIGKALDHGGLADACFAGQNPDCSGGGA